MSTDQEGGVEEKPECLWWSFRSRAQYPASSSSESSSLRRSRPKDVQLRRSGLGVQLCVNAVSPPL